LDRLRDEFNLAIWIEHHAPWGEKGKREVRAIGSSRWARWMDYTVNLIPEKPNPPFDRLLWRSVRREETRMSPIALRRGGKGEPSWVPEWSEKDEGFFHARDVAETA
jgi:hypothetical protein